MKIVADGKVIVADGYVANPKDLTIQFYREKSELDVIPPIRIDADMLSDFGKELLKTDKQIEEAKDADN